MMIVAYDRDGNVLNLLVSKPEISLKRESYATAQRAGVQLHCEIDVPNSALSKDDVYLRSGIYDLQSTNAGTLEIPLHAPSVSAVAAK